MRDGQKVLTGSRRRVFHAKLHIDHFSIIGKWLVLTILLV